MNEDQGYVPVMGIVDIMDWYSLINKRQMSTGDFECSMEKFPIKSKTNDEWMLGGIHNFNYDQKMVFLNKITGIKDFNKIIPRKK